MVLGDFYFVWLIVINKSFDKMEDFIASMSYGGELQRIFAKGNFIYRGHASEKYELVPSSLRKRNISKC